TQQRSDAWEPIGERLFFNGLLGVPSIQALLDSLQGWQQVLAKSSSAGTNVMRPSP
ncbi:MAG: hypothetical protein ACI8PQ_003515, partial [Planctomycetota bacterium]